MDHSAIPLILQEIDLHEDCIANIYLHGSWVYGTNLPTSDRDLIIVTRLSNQEPVKFIDEYDYFHQFELHKLWNEYDVCIYSMNHFEKLLEKNYLCSVQCLFLPNEFKIKEDIDFRPIYLEKYYDKLRLKHVAFYEMLRDWELYESHDYSNHPVCSSRSLRNRQLRKDYIFKNLFHGLRYLDFAQQLIQTKSIHNFQRVSYLFNEMKEIRQNATDDSYMKQVAEYVQIKSNELKSKLDELIPRDIIKGTFKVSITFDCTHNTEQTIDKLKKTCENTKYKLIFIELDSYKDKLEQLIVTLNYNDEYPLIIKQIENEISQDFQNFNIIRIKIKSFESNEGIPKTDLEKRIFWNDQTNYFEFRYKILIKTKHKKRKLKDLRKICRNKRLFNLHISHNAFEQNDGENIYYMITNRIFDVGQINAYEHRDKITKFLTSNHFLPLKVLCEFVVYDTNINLDKDWI